MTKEDVTKTLIPYPKGEEPNIIIPKDYSDYRYVIGREGGNPLVVLCMNPSRASDDYSDRTINTVIKTSNKFGYDGWFVVNLYPERGTKTSDLIRYSGEDELRHAWIQENARVIEKLLKEYGVSEVWGAWGSSTNLWVNKSKPVVLEKLKNNDIKVWAIGPLSKTNSPHHPLYLKIEIDRKHYISFD